MKYYGNDYDTYCVPDSGKVYHLQSIDGGDLPQEVDSLPDNVLELSPELCCDIDTEGVE